MRRRDFLSCSIATGAACGQVMSGLANAAPDQTVELDQYGGWTAKAFRATGFFRLEKDERWWMVTPEGNAFLSWGINHFYPDLWNQDYNRDVWRETLGVDRLQGSKFNAALRKWFIGISGRLGFNTVGVHNQLRILNTPQPKMAYMQPIRFVDIPHWKTDVPDENFWDIFSPEFEAHCDKLAKEIALPLKDDPYLLAYSMTDCSLFTEEDLRERPDVIGGARRKSRIGWPRRLRNLGKSAPGKRAYVETMRKLYRDSIEDFNTTYGGNFESYDALAEAENWRIDTQLSNAMETRDNIAFLQLCVGKYYQTARDAIRRYDPNHMFFGDKINANTDSLDTVLPITAQYTDLVFYQMYARYEVQQPGLDRWAKLTDKPFVNGDSAFTMTTETMPRPYGPVADNVEERAAWTAEFFLRAFSRPDFVGWHYCGLIDASNLVPRKRSRQHSGLLDGYGKAYPNLERILKECSEDKYAIATSRN